MSYYCEKCKKLHDGDEMCPHIANRLKSDPKLLAEAANFTVVAGEYHLASSQTLDVIAKGINKIAGTNLSYEGANQAARDIQVFKKLSTDAFSKIGVFNNAQAAQDYVQNASQGQLDYLGKRFAGTGGEIDWQRWKDGKLSALWEKHVLPDGNTPGIDGVTINRFTGKIVERASVKMAQTGEGLYTNTKDVLEALKKGTLQPNDSVYGVEGIKESLDRGLKEAYDTALRNGDSHYADTLKSAADHLKITERGTVESVKASNERLMEKVLSGNAHTAVTLQEVSKKMAQGAIIGAAIGLSVSAVTNYIRYRNGEITQDEAFREVGEGTAKGLLTGGALGGVALFLPGGPLGFVAGVAIGIYVNAACVNVLDEVFGKGAFGAILDASGYVYGGAVNLRESLEKISADQRRINYDTAKMVTSAKKIDKKLDEFDGIINS